MSKLTGDFVCLAAACFFALLAAGTDIKSRRIPNWLTGTALLFGIVLHALRGGWRDALISLAVGIAAGCIFLLLYLAGGMGAGDVKLIASLATIVGSQNVPYLLVFTSLIGGIIGLFLAFRYKRLKETMNNIAILLFHHSRHGLTPHAEINVKNPVALRLPYAVPIAIGTLMTLYFREILGGS